MIDRVLCALPFKDTAFGLTRPQTTLSLSSTFFFTLFYDLRLESHGSDLRSYYCTMHSDVIHRVLLSVDWKNTFRNSDYRDLFCSSVFSRLLLFPFVRFSENSCTMSQFMVSKNWLVYRWFSSISLSLFLSPSLLRNSCGFTRWHDATRHWLLRVRISNFRTFSTNFRWWICANLVPWIFERAFFLLFFNFCARFRRMDGSQAGSSPRKRESLLSRV